MKLTTETLNEFIDKVIEFEKATPLSQEEIFIADIQNETDFKNGMLTALQMVKEWNCGNDRS